MVRILVIEAQMNTLFHYFSLYINYKIKLFAFY